MKRYILIGIITGLVLLCTTLQIRAQVGTNVNTQPLWGPQGYARADYYYLPDIESYYSISTHQFIYLSGGRWVYTNSLPPNYAHYDLYSGYKVVINKPRPYLDFGHDRTHYAQYRNYQGKQLTLRDTHPTPK